MLYEKTETVTGCYGMTAEVVTVMDHILKRQNQVKAAIEFVNNKKA